MSTFPVPGDSLHARACALAGILAEHGFTSLRLQSGGESTSVLARDTDLPNLLAELAHRHLLVSIFDHRHRLLARLGLDSASLHFIPDDIP